MLRTQNVDQSQMITYKATQNLKLTYITSEHFRDYVNHPHKSKLYIEIMKKGKMAKTRESWKSQKDLVNYTPRNTSSSSNEKANKVPELVKSCGYLIHILK